MWGEGAFAGTEAAEWFSNYLEGEGFKMYLTTKPRYLNTDEVWKAIAQPKDKVICETNIRKWGVYFVQRILARRKGYFVQLLC